jgi:predicted permease
MARLVPGATEEDARTRLDLLASQLQDAYPETNRDISFRVLSFDGVAISPELDQGLQFTAVFLLVVVGLVLLLACTNLASFLLARGVERQKEVAMRLALGAGRGRLIGQLLTETLLLGLMGGLVGLVVARATLAFVMAYQPPIPVSLSLELGLDQRVLLFTLGISALAGVLFGLVPALQSTKPDVAPTLKEGGGSGDRKRFTLQTALVALQMTVSMILLVGGGLFIRSLITAQTMDPGFSTDEAGIAWLDLRGSGLPREEWNAIRIDLEERLQAQPGIQTVTSSGRFPLSLGSITQTFQIPGADPQAGQDGHLLNWAQVSPGYFDAMGIPILAGRALTAEDRAGTPEVIVISQETARRFWPGDDPLGKQVFRGPGTEPITVVGVARDVKVSTLGEPPTPFIYFSMDQNPPSTLNILVRGGLPQAELVATLRRVIREAHPSLMVIEVKTMDELLSVRLFGARAAAALLGTFGFLALLLSSIGLYGVVSFSVSRRVREMGIRMSLGADARQVVRMVVGRALGVVVVGGAVGLGLAYVLARLVRVFLLGVAPADPVTLVGVPLLLGSVALVAALIPARRASRVNPVEALRSE